MFIEFQHIGVLNQRKAIINMKAERFLLVNTSTSLTAFHEAFYRLIILLAHIEVTLHLNVFLHCV